ncbi:MAG: 4-hydroxy-tetrahydrodipicolinate reductase [Bacteroidetes bacterium]|nr:MAG: 4-hydroxy-tetrahydrodipicolinate reductase [Bacteroidota bacterium]
MKIAIIGYGKMGKVIEKLALDNNHEVCLKVTSANKNFSAEELKNCDVAIEFSTPQSAKDNILKCFEANIPVVVGTTGWYDDFEEVRQICEEKKQRLFYASNFSIGMNIFFQLAEFAAKIMEQYPEYDIEIEEVHHTEKKDAPSGTAITLAQKIMKHISRKTSWTPESPKPNEIYIDSARIKDVPGTHTIVFSSEIDDIHLTHQAHNRLGFASGALKAAEWVIHQPPGVYTMEEMMNFSHFFK